MPSGYWFLPVVYITFEPPEESGSRLMLVLLNVYYLAYYFYRQWKTAELKSAEPLVSANNAMTETKNNRETFLVQRGAQSIPLPVERIAYFYREGDYNYLATFESERYLVPQSLDEVETQLDKVVYFRANRQFIVQHKACIRFAAMDHGKLELFVTPEIKGPVIISQRRTKYFKEWMRR